MLSNVSGAPPPRSRKRTHGSRATEDGGVEEEDAGVSTRPGVFVDSGACARPGANVLDTGALARPGAVIVDPGASAHPGINVRNVNNHSVLDVYNQHDVRDRGATARPATNVNNAVHSSSVVNVHHHHTHYHGSSAGVVLKASSADPRHRDSLYWFAVTREQFMVDTLVFHGFSVPVATRMASKQRGSTLELYEGKWRGYLDWCLEFDHHPVDTSSIILADFFVFLHNKGFKSPTIDGYRSAIAGPIRFASDVNFGEDNLLSSLLANFKKDIPARSPVPPWDMTLVLTALRTHPFEPMDTCDLQKVIWKTAFLLALASAKRVSELHALVHPFAVSQRDGSAILTFNPGFIAKTDLPDHRSLCQELVIPSLRGFVDTRTEAEDLLLCPVRALQIYDRRTLPVRNGRRKLFISAARPGLPDVKVSTLSSWIKQLLVYVYNHHQVEFVNAEHFTRKTHSVRGLATSLALMTGVSLEQVLRAGTWTTHSTFTAKYLHDMTVQVGTLKSLGPLVAAQHVVQVPTRSPSPPRRHRHRRRHHHHH